MQPIHIVGAIFIAYIVIKEVFVIVKGETKQIAKDMAAMKESFLIKGADNKNVAEQVSDTYSQINAMASSVAQVKDQIEDLHKWHDKEDDDGVKIWYLRRSLEDSIKKLPVTLEQQRELMESMFKIFDQLREDLAAIKESSSNENPKQ